MNNLPITPLDADNPEIDGVPISYGLAPILNTLVHTMPFRERNAWQVYMVNMETMLRNVMNDSRLSSDPINATLDECRLLAQYIHGYISGMPLRIRPALCFYLPDYSNLPSQYLKDRLPAGTVERWNAKQRLRNEWSHNWGISYEDLDVFGSEVTNDNKAWVPLALANDVDSRLGNASIKYLSVLMISHVALDFHICRRCKTFTLLESHTGNFKKPSDLGKKVFGHAEVPFSKYTHVVFGDKQLLKPQFLPRARREVAERAKNEVWLKWSDQAVLSALDKMHLVNTRILTTPKV